MTPTETPEDTPHEDVDTDVLISTHVVLDHNEDDPTSYAEAMGSHDAEHWKRAMEEEVANLE